MNAKLTAVGTLLAGIVLWLWGAVTHTAIPEPMQRLTNEAAVTEFVKQNTPANGVYYDPRGMLISVYGQPKWVDQTSDMGSFLAKELLACFGQAFLLLLLFSRMRPMDTMGYGISGAIAGLFAWTAVDVSFTIWYGINLAMLGIAFLDNVGGGLLAGLVLGWRIRASR
jgi:hypothetical protein